MTSEAPVALVTGSRKGIGRAVAQHLLKKGYRVCGCSRQAVAWSANSYVHNEVDVSDEAQVKSLFISIGKNYGRLDVVINCAAVASMNHVLLTPVRSVERMMSANLQGTFLISREAAKLMRSRMTGRIVNFSSIAVPMHLSGQAVYAASKAAVEELSRVMAKELAEYGITVNVIGPPPMDTDMTRGVPKRTLERLVQSLPTRRLGTFEDVANVIDFLIKPESDAVTGQVIYLAGVPN